MKKILFLDQYGQLGGGQQILLELVRAALVNDFAVSVLLPDGACADTLESLGVEVCRVSPCILSQGRKRLVDILHIGTYTLSVFIRYIKLLRSSDLIYVNGNRMLFVAMLAQRFLGKHAVCHIHLNHGSLEKRLFRIFFRYKRTLGIVVPSAFIHRELVQFDPYFLSSRVYLVENGLDERFSQTDFEDRVSERPLQQVGIVGRVSPEKGQDVLPVLARLFPDMDFHVLGDAAFSSTNFYAHLERNSPANIHFHGWVEDLPSKIREIGLQICLVPSRCPKTTPGHSFEAAPLVPLQMAALSCLVLVRRLGALEDVATNLQLGSFYTDDDLKLLIEAVRAQPGSKTCAQCERSHALTVSRYSHRAFHERLKNFFHTIMAEKV